MAIITIIFAAVLPQFRVIQNSWDSRQANTEVLQNGRVLIDHISRNLSKAVKITAVSDSNQTNGYIQFIADVNDSNTYRYDIGESNYVEYGPVGSLADLAGPVNSLQFTCYDGNDFTNTTTDGNSIRFVDVETTLPNPAALGQDKTFTASAYLRTNAYNGGIVGCWKLDETSGTTAADSSGKGNDGNLVNMTAPGCWVIGHDGNALAFDGTDDYVDLGTDSSLDFADSEPFTVSAWVKTTDSCGMIVSFRSSTDDTPVIDLAVGYDGGADDPCKVMILVRQNGGSGYAHVTGGKVSDGFWHHVAAVRGSGSTIELFLDGVTQGTNSGTGSGGAITTDWRAIGSERRWVNVGYGTADERYLAGTIDDVRIYNRALALAEIAHLANIPTYRGFSKAKQDSDTNSIVISRPDTNTGDLLIAAVATDGDTSTTITVPGWTLINRGAPIGGRVTLGAWRKVSTGASEPASYTFNWTGNQQAYGWIMRFTGYDATSPSPINKSATADQNNIAPTSPPVTTSVPNCLILRLGAFDDTSVTPDNNNLLSGHDTITAGSSSGSSTIPNYQAVGNARSGTGAITVPWPAHLTGDVALLFVESCGGHAITLSTPAGFVNVLNSPQATGAGATGTRLTVFWCRATSAAMSSPTVAATANHVYGRILTFRNVVATGNPWDVTAGGTKATASGTTTFGTVTTSVNNDLIVLAASRDNDSTAAAWTDASWTNTNLSSLTERQDGGTTSGNGGGVGVATGLKSTAGDTGPTTATVTSSVDGHMTIALKPIGDGTVSGGAGFVKQSLAGGSGTSNFQLTASKDARMLTIAIAPADNGSYDCCGDYLQP